MAAWSTRGQVSLKHRLAQRDGVPLDATGSSLSPQQPAGWLRHDFPLDDAAMRPTLLGNALTTAGEHPKLAYALEGLLWWPRLVPILPAAFLTLVSDAQAPLMALLNLNLVFTALAFGGLLTFGLAGGQWIAAIVTLVGGVVLARLCYRAAVSQAAELAGLLSVGFDLYRHELLRQMDLKIPKDLGAERELWPQLTLARLGLPHSAPLPPFSRQAPENDD
jgi:hypothetical protein